MPIQLCDRGGKNVNKVTLVALMYLLFEHKVTPTKIGVLQTFDNKKVESSISKKNNNKSDLYQIE